MSNNDILTGMTVDIKEYDCVIVFLHEYYDHVMDMTERLSVVDGGEGQVVIPVNEQTLRKTGIEESVDEIINAAVVMIEELDPDNKDEDTMIGIERKTDGAVMTIDKVIFQTIAGIEEI